MASTYLAPHRQLAFDDRDRCPTFHRISVLLSLPSVLQRKRDCLLRCPVFQIVQKEEFDPERIRFLWLLMPASS
jgi:hypothetical protein